MGKVIEEHLQTAADSVVRTQNPARPGEIVYECAPATADSVRAALRVATEAAPSWATAPPATRASVLSRAADVLLEQVSELARLITREEGKTLAEATGEVRKTAEQFRFAAELAYLVEGATYPVESPGVFAYTLRVPIGVVVAITPWNFPISLAARKIAPALAAGNAVLFKPSPVTAGSGAALHQACLDAGVPGEVLQLVQGADPDAMAALVGSAETAAVSFTGSDAVGAAVRRTTNPRARLQFELGGHNAAVVCADARLEQAVRDVSAGAFGLTGQACTATDRVLVDRRIYGEFLELLAARVSDLRVGPGDDATTTLGPVATAAQFERLTKLAASAAAAGRQVATGSVSPVVDPDGYWVAPALYADVPADHPLNTTEIFGPFLSVIPVESPDEATAIVQASHHGLVSAIHTQDLATAQRFTKQVACGIVKVNERTTGNAVAPPFGGWKASSSGAFPEGGRGALEFVTDIKTVYVRYEEAQ